MLFLCIQFKAACLISYTVYYIDDIILLASLIKAIYYCSLLGYQYSIWLLQ